MLNWDEEVWVLNWVSVLLNSGRHAQPEGFQAVCRVIGTVMPFSQRRSHSMVPPVAKALSLRSLVTNQIVLVLAVMRGMKYFNVRRCLGTYQILSSVVRTSGGRVHATEKQ